MLSRTRWARASSMATTGLYRKMRSRTSRTMKLIVCQIRPFQFSPRVPVIASIWGLDEQLDLADQDEGDDQRVDGDGFREAKTDQQWHQDRADDLGIATDRLHGLTDPITDTDARPDSPKADGNSRRPDGRCAAGGSLSEETELNKHACLEPPVRGHRFRPAHH